MSVILSGFQGVALPNTAQDNAPDRTNFHGTLLRNGGRTITERCLYRRVSAGFSHGNISAAPAPLGVEKIVPEIHPTLCSVLRVTQRAAVRTTMCSVLGLQRVCGGLSTRLKHGGSDVGSGVPAQAA